ncbi:MAG: S16 family serine protease, partial [Candidatus Norongarragalinales archaeon]
EEKLRIARRYLIPDLAQTYALQGKVELSDKALRTVIRKYTREAGVAELRTNLKTLFQAGLKESEKGGTKVLFKISTRNLGRYLGPPRFSFDTDHGRNEVGLVTVLGKSEKGGCPISLELLVMKGEGKLITTGNTDKMFQESALVALDYIRSRHERFGIDEDFYRKYDFHFHLQEGAVPKYGVSAGLAIVTVLVSGL